MKNENEELKNINITLNKSFNEYKNKNAEINDTAL